jgi:hypothetical protein
VVLGTEVGAHWARLELPVYTGASSRALLFSRLAWPVS